MNGQRLPRVRWPLALPVLAVLCCAALYAGLGALWVAALLGALFLLSDLIVFLACLSDTQVYQGLSAVECITGETLGLDFQIRAPSTGGLCLFAVCLAEYTYFDMDPPELSWRKLDTLNTGAAVRAAGVGSQRAGVLGLRLYSPMGLFSKRLRLHTAGREGPRPVLVLPRLRPVAVPPFAEYVNLGQRDRRTISSGDVDSVSGSREYVEGDPLSRVNWKLTAARRELYVKDFDSVGLRERSVLYVAPFSKILRQHALEAALAGGALLLEHNDLILLLGGCRSTIRRGDVTLLARELARCPDMEPDTAGQNDVLAALSAERACSAVVTDGDERTCRLLGALPRGSLAFALGAPAWSKQAVYACRMGNVNLCMGRTGEEWQWLHA